MQSTQFSDGACRGKRTIFGSPAQYKSAIVVRAPNKVVMAARWATPYWMRIHRSRRCGSIRGDKNHLAHHLTVHHIIKCLRSMVKWIGRGDDRLDLTRCKPGEKFLKMLLVAPGIACRERTPKYTNDGAALE